ncbi:formin-like protein 5 [Phacochoerus africanus]|uniref:formin-like protein 5 n=1 Tax=Phacochoerus africanus TaxID=41426 RepID=UPI001FD8A038|nr:formin-like protein 5 [Phacochoerus africanus]
MGLAFELVFDPKGRACQNAHHSAHRLGPTHPAAAPSGSGSAPPCPAPPRCLDLYPPLPRPASRSPPESPACSQRPRRRAALPARLARLRGTLPALASSPAAGTREDEPRSFGPPGPGRTGTARGAGVPESRQKYCESCCGHVLCRLTSGWGSWCCRATAWRPALVIPALQHLAQTLPQQAAVWKEMIRKVSVHGKRTHFKICLDASPLQVTGASGRNRGWFSVARA